MSDLKLDYLKEVKETIGNVYENISDGEHVDHEDWLQVIAEALVSIANSLDILAYKQFHK